MNARGRHVEDDAVDNLPVAPDLELHVQRYLGAQLLGGLIESSRILVEQWLAVARPRLQGGPQHPHELGLAASIMMMASFAAEVALKQIHLTAADEEPRHTHNLAVLVGNLPSGARSQLYAAWESASTPVAHALADLWKGDLDQLLEMCPNGFEEWRYLYETRPTNGVPALLLRLAVAAANVAVELYDKHPERTS